MNKSKNNSEMKNSNDSQKFEDWARHYDSLLWTMSTLFLGILSIMLFSIDNDKPSLMYVLFGYFLTLAVLYFATSFRELRYLVGKESNERLKKVYQQKRKFPQWLLFNIIFFFLSLFWLIEIYNMKTMVPFLNINLAFVVAFFGVTIQIFFYINGRTDK